MEPYDAAYVPAPAGFRNTGAICWLNSLMQSLLSCPTFTRAVVRAESDLARSKIGATVHALAKDSLNNAPVAHYTGQLRAAICEQKHFGYGQECAAEGLTLLLDTIRAPAVTDVLTYRYRVGRVCFPCKAVAEDSHKENLGHAIRMFHYDGKESFIDALKLQVDELDHSEFACSCGNMQSRVYRLTMLPEVVVVQFNKFFGKRLLPFPEEFVVDGTAGQKMKFRQVAQIEHSGSMHGGHYWALCRRADGIYCLNDQSCSRVPGFAPTVNTHMVFYSYVGDA